MSLLSGDVVDSVSAEVYIVVDSVSVEVYIVVDSVEH